MAYVVDEIKSWDKITLSLMDRLLNEAGIRRDMNLDYSCGIFDDNNNLVGCGSSYKNTLRCLAVSPQYQGEGLMNMVISHLIGRQIDKGNNHIFLYTKNKNSRIFSDLGFYPIAEIENELVFMENQRQGFTNYLKNLEKYKKEGKSASIVMNANPFTLGHRYLVENAIKNNDYLHIFVLSEEASPIPFSVRKKLVLEGVADLKNVIVHNSEDYIISSATFPSYFLADEKNAILAQARLDLAVFAKIAKVLNISERYAGEEKFSKVTALYNQTMAENLVNMGIKFCEIERLKINNEVVSASTVREKIKNNNLADILYMLPKTTIDFFKSSEAKSIIEGIKKMENARHY